MKKATDAYFTSSLGCVFVIQLDNDSVIDNINVVDTIKNIYDKNNIFIESSSTMELDEWLLHLQGIRFNTVSFSAPKMATEQFFMPVVLPMLPCATVATSDGRTAISNDKNITTSSDIVDKATVIGISDRDDKSIRAASEILGSGSNSAPPHGTIVDKKNTILSEMIDTTTTTITPKYIQEENDVQEDSIKIYNDTIDNDILLQPLPSEQLILPQYNRENKSVIDDIVKVNTLSDTTLIDSVLEKLENFDKKHSQLEQEVLSSSSSSQNNTQKNINNTKLDIINEKSLVSTSLSQDNIIQKYHITSNKNIQLSETIIVKLQNYQKLFLKYIKDLILRIENTIKEDIKIPKNSTIYENISTIPFLNTMATVLTKDILERINMYKKDTNNIIPT